ncbi:hypothetical protein [Citricoccus sp. NR2]|uniref:hypothetical protein n=1 Tax=Citricoccus sp. NR2 TaxID=3004095 RepID=UPI0022DD07DA|nr:hypothetical protein [Citricoccus sp. NR2]WBL17841.1 hypothetical protein O1A05_08445 [Citricoccus sp. NR2]
MNRVNSGVNAAELIDHRLVAHMLSIFPRLIGELNTYPKRIPVEFRRRGGDFSDAGGEDDRRRGIEGEFLETEGQFSDLMMVERRDPVRPLRRLLRARHPREGQPG